MRDQELTPALLRADAERMRDAAFEAAGEFGQAEAHPFIRAATALEEKAARLEQGERVCRWAWDDEALGYATSCHKRIVNVVPAYCPDCGGRVVLGDATKEGGSLWREIPPDMDVGPLATLTIYASVECINVNKPSGGRVVLGDEEGGR